MPIKINNPVQTGENIQLGGLKLGLIKLVYQVPILGAVNKEPMNPVDEQIKIEIRNKNGFFIFLNKVFLSYNKYCYFNFS